MKIKPLVWYQVYDLLWISAIYSSATYSIEKKHYYYFSSLVENPDQKSFNGTNIESRINLRNHTTLEEAKQACQDHFEEWISHFIENEL